MQKTKPRISVGKVGTAAHVSDRMTLKDANAFEASRLTKARPLTLLVDHAISTKALVAEGHYTDVSSDLFAMPRVNSKRTVEYEARIVHFDEIIGSVEAKRRISKEKGGWKVAHVEHLLTLGKTFPHLQGQFPIVALGTVMKKRRLSLVACLHHGDGPKRYVVLRWLGDDWCGDFAFLAVRKKK